MKTWKMPLVVILSWIILILFQCSPSTRSDDQTARTKSNPDELTNETQSCNPQENESVVETRVVYGYSIEVLGFSGPSAESYSLRICKDGYKVDEINLYTEGSGGAALVMLSYYGNWKFENDSTVRVEKGSNYIGPTLNGKHFPPGDSMEYKEGKGFYSLTGEQLPYVNEFHAGHIEYYKIKPNWKIKRITWDEDWSSLDTLRKAKLVFIRNEVFARHGYKFKTEPFRSYFSHPYEQKYDDVSDQLTAEEKKFVEYVKKLEDQMDINSTNSIRNTSLQCNTLEELGQNFVNALVRQDLDILYAISYSEASIKETIIKTQPDEAISRSILNELNGFDREARSNTTSRYIELRTAGKHEEGDPEVLNWNEIKFEKIEFTSAGRASQKRLGIEAGSAYVYILYRNTHYRILIDKVAHFLDGWKCLEPGTTLEQLN